MNIVFVRHQSWQTKEYCFEVPDEFIRYMRNPVGLLVKCETYRGVQSGRITMGGLSGGEAEEAAKAAGAHFPLKKICAVEVPIPMGEIMIPTIFARTTPSIQKLNKRIQEYQTHQTFNTKITVGTDGCLRDGYTAYLTAKQLNLPAIKCLLTV